MKRPSILALLALALCAFAIVPDIIDAKAMDAQAQCKTSIHFVITDISANTAPAFVVIERDGYLDESVPLERVTGNVAHYTTTNLLGVPMRHAWAYRPPLWSGQFNLSCAATAVTLTALGATTNGNDTLVLLLSLMFVALAFLMWYALKKVGL